LERKISTSFSHAPEKFHSNAGFLHLFVFELEATYWMDRRISKNHNACLSNNQDTTITIIHSILEFPC